MELSLSEVLRKLGRAQNEANAKKVFERMNINPDSSKYNL